MNGCGEELCFFPRRSFYETVEADGGLRDKKQCEKALYCRDKAWFWRDLVNQLIKAFLMLKLELYLELFLALDISKCVFLYLKHSSSLCHLYIY